MLAGADIAHLTGPDSPLHAVVADRLDAGPGAAVRGDLTITVEPVDFTGWARSAVVVAPGTSSALSESRPGAVPGDLTPWSDAAASVAIRLTSL